MYLSNQEITNTRLEWLTIVVRCALWGEPRLSVAAVIVRIMRIKIGAVVTTPKHSRKLK